MRYPAGGEDPVWAVGLTTELLGVLAEPDILIESSARAAAGSGGFTLPGQKRG